MSNIYIAGSLVRVYATFTNQAGAPVDPTAITLKFGLSSAPTTWVYGGTGSIVKDSVGNYHADIDTTPVGVGGSDVTWLYQWQATGTGQCVGNGVFIIQPLAA